MPQQTILRTNRVSTADTRTETLDGTDYLVVPDVTVGKPTTLDGGYIPSDVWDATSDDWQNVPLPVGHPTDTWGNYLSANTPEIIDSTVVGRLFNAEYDADGDGLVGELWIDHEKATDLGGNAQTVVDQLESGDGLEVSTAYTGTKGDPGVYDGEYHDDVLVDIRPDHVALLPGDLGPGNCSLADGCGVPEGVATTEFAANNAAAENPATAVDGHEPLRLYVNARSQSRTPDYSGTTTSEWNAPTLSDYKAAYDGEADFDGVTDAPSEFTTFVANHTLLGEATGETFDDVSFFPVVVPSSGSLNANALRAVLSGRGAQADISESALESARSTAGDLLRDEFGADVETNTADSSSGAQAGHANDDEIADPDAGVVAAVRHVLADAFSGATGRNAAVGGNCGDDCACDDCGAAASSEVSSGTAPNSSDTTHEESDGTTTPADTPAPTAPDETTTPNNSDTMTDDNSPYANLSVSRDDLVDATPFDGDTLDQMDESQLKHIAANAGPGDDEGANETVEQDADDDDATDDDGANEAAEQDADDDPEADDDAETNAADTSPLTAADVVTALKEDGDLLTMEAAKETFATKGEVEPAVNVAEQAAETKREQLVNALDGRTEFSRDDLEDMDTSRLELLDEGMPGDVSANERSGADFSPMNSAPADGGLGTNAADDDDDVGPKTAGTLQDYREQMGGDD